MNNNFMLLAIREARKNICQPKGGPFGACIVKNGKTLAVARNTVLAHDATCHAEVNAIRKASRLLKTYDLNGCEIYSTTEPCPMCFGAIHWAQIRKIYFGTNIADVQKRGFNELAISNSVMKRLGKSGLQIVSDFQRAECLNLLREWDSMARRVVY